MKSKQVIHLITFAGGDKKYFDAQRRLVKQARKLNYFDSIIEYDLQKLSSNFYELFGNIFIKIPKGFGGYSWKPWIIHDQLAKMNEGEILFYLDVGFEVNRKARGEVYKYIDMIKEKKILVFSTGHKQIDYTKPDLRLVDYRDTETMQISAAFIAIEKCEYSQRVVKNWLELSCINRGELLNLYVNNANGEIFINHRYDQSVLTKVLRDENYIAEYPDPTYDTNWLRLQNSPFINFRNFSRRSVVVIELSSGLLGLTIKLIRFLLKRTGFR
jgi:hypothetical protein